MPPGAKKMASGIGSLNSLLMWCLSLRLTVNTPFGVTCPGEPGSIWTGPYITTPLICSQLTLSFRSTQASAFSGQRSAYGQRCTFGGAAFLPAAADASDVGEFGDFGEFAADRCWSASGFAFAGTGFGWESPSACEVGDTTIQTLTATPIISARQVTRPCGPRRVSARRAPARRAAARDCTVAEACLA